MKKTQKTLSENKKASVLIDPEILSPFKDTELPAGLVRDIRALIAQQCTHWALLSRARGDFQRTVQTKTLTLSDTHVIVQQNPSRIRSTASAVDKKSVSERPCFLCAENLFPEQKAISFKDNWHIINNPFPVCMDHLVINHNRHTPQNIEHALESMVCFVSETKGYFDAFYNGPSCGASAPDHLHYQACPAGWLPLASNLERMLLSGKSHPKLTALHTDDANSAILCSGTLDKRGFLACHADHPHTLLKILTAAIDFLRKTDRDPAEPMINVIISGGDDGLFGIVLPRRKHRPACFFYKHGEGLLISPGAVDIGGMVILPRKKDFAAITPDRLEAIYGEVCRGPERFSGFANLQSCH